MTTSPHVHWWTSLTLLVLAGLLVAVFGGRQKELTVVPRGPDDQNILRVAYTADLRPDPCRRLFPLPQYNQLILSLWEPLVECDFTTGLPQPAAATSWTWSADRRTLTLKLRPDARWSNGDPVTAQDFVRGWTRLLQQNPALAVTLFPLKNAEAYHDGRLKNISAVGMRARDDHTLRLTLDRPRSTLLKELADPLLAPLHRSSEDAFRTAAYFARPAALVTNGAFRLVGAGADGFRLEANKYYHGQAQVRLAGVNFIRADNLMIAPLLVAAGVADLLSPVPSGPTGERPTARPVVLETELALGITFLDFNVKRGPLRDVRVRQALALALDRMGPIQKFDPLHLVPAWSWVPTIPGRTGLNLLHEDAGAARRLLAEAGFPGGKGFPVLRLALPLWKKSDPFPLAVSEQWFRALGVTTYVSYETPTKWLERMMAGDYDLQYGTIVATVPDAGDLFSGFAEPAMASGNKWTDPEVTGLLDQANTLTGTERFAALEKAERLIMNAVPSVPLLFERRQIVRAAEVRGWKSDPLARQELKQLWLDAPVVEEAPASRL